MQTLWQDLRYGLRMLAKAPGFTGVAVLTLALGIGANTAIFSVINATLLKSVPYPNASRMVFVWQTYGSEPNNLNIVSAPNIWDIRKQNHVLEDIGIFDSAGKGYDLGGGQDSERVSGVRVSAGFFDVLGIKPLLGRTFLPEEEVRGKDHEVVLTYGLWERRFGGDRGIIGKQIRIDGESHTVVGVMPRDFEFQFWSRERQLFVPVGYTEGDYGRDSNSFVAVARLKPGVTVPEAAAQVKAIGDGLAKEYPKDDARMSATVTPLLYYDMGPLAAISLVLLVAVGFVLLIGCVNVANLLLARGVARQRELAVRRALGATSGRLLRQLITENLLLGIFGGIAGLGISSVALSLFIPLLPVGLQSLPFRQVGAIGMDGRVFAYALLLACGATVIFGLVPALGARWGHLIDPLKEGQGHGHTSAKGSRLRHALVAAEVALALIVLTGAGLMIASLMHLMGVDSGLNAKNVLTLGVSTAQKNPYYSPPDDAHFCQEMTQSVGAIPGVISVGGVAHLPLSGGSAGRGFVIEGQPIPPPGQEAGANYSVACPNFFRTMGIPIVEGREFTDTDTVDSPQVIVVNQTMARRYWPKENALGKHIRIGGAVASGPWLAIVGVVGDFRYQALEREPRPYFFRPFTQAGWPTMSVVVRTASAAKAFEKPIREALTQLNGKYPPSNATTMEEVLSNVVSGHRFVVSLLSAYALLALALSAVGITGVVGYSVVQRTHEIGIRMALGAQPRDVLKLVIGRSMLWTLGGVAAGILGALALAQLLSSLLYGVQPTDPVILGGTAALLSLVALAACYFPARKAMRVDPIVALRYE